jgi:hypothetical protein
MDRRGVALLMSQIGHEMCHWEGWEWPCALVPSADTNS